MFHIRQFSCKMVHQQINRIILYYFKIHTLLTGLLVVCVYLPLAYLLVRPISKYTYLQIKYYLGYSVYGFLAESVNSWGITDIKLYVNKSIKRYLEKEHLFIICNHCAEIDWILLGILTNHLHMLGNIRGYLRKEAQYVPVIGWFLSLYNYTFLKRDYTKDKELLIGSAKNIPEHNNPTPILYFAEGTRFNEERHKASIKFATERGLKQLKYHLIPKTKGLTTILPLLREHLPAIYDVELSFGKTTPSFSNVFNRIPLEVHMYIRRIPIKDVPESAEELEMFLHELYLHKDAVQENFLKNRDHCESIGKVCEVIHIGQPKLLVYNVFLWCFVSTCLTTCIIFFACMHGYYIIVSIITIILLSLMMTLKMFESIMAMPKNKKLMGDT